MAALSFEFNVRPWLWLGNGEARDPRETSVRHPLPRPRTQRAPQTHPARRKQGRPSSYSNHTRARVIFLILNSSSHCPNFIKQKLQQSWDFVGSLLWWGNSHSPQGSYNICTVVHYTLFYINEFRNTSFIHYWEHGVLHINVFKRNTVFLYPNAQVKFDP